MDRTRIRIAAALVGLWLVLGAGPAAAQSICAPHATVVDQLAKRYSEVPRAIGLADRGGIVELFATPDGRTWTIVVTNPNGTSCIIGAGESWEPVEHLAAGPSA